MERGRLALRVQAILLRSIASFVMFLNRFGRPRPLSPHFSKIIPTTLAPRRGRLRLVFYTPADYGKSGNKERYPVLINFHGGGFVFGSATDDARWATAVVRHANTVVCSVDYRLAPEYPFPTGVEDSADAMMYIWDHAEELGLDKERIGVSGFSAGGNLCFSATLRLQEALASRRAAVDDTMQRIALEERERQVVKIIVAWYPPIDFTGPLSERLAHNPRPNEDSPGLYAFFNACYHSQQENIALDSPYLSPGKAPDERLAHLPQDILIYPAEWDGLCKEAEVFRERLKGLGKDVRGSVISGVSHGWDKKKLTLFEEDQAAQEAYQEVCKEIKRVFYRD